MYRIFVTTIFCGTDNPPSSSEKIQERVLQLYLYSASMPSANVIGQTLPFYPPYLKKVLEMVSLASKEVPHITNKLLITYETSFGDTENTAFQMLSFRLSLV